MTGKERMKIAMERRKPDRVPLMCQLAVGHYFLHTDHDPVEIWHDGDIFVKALVELADRYHFDGILVNLPGRPLDWRDWIDRREERADSWRVFWKAGGYTDIPKDDNAHYFPPENEPAIPPVAEVDPALCWYAEPHDITGMKYPYRWGFDTEIRPPGDFFPFYQYDTIEAALSLVGDRLSVHSEIFSPFSQFMEMFEMEDALTSLMDRPEKCEAILSRFTEGAIELGRGQASRGVDAVLISSAYAGGGFISRKMYEWFVLPYEHRVIKGIKSERNVPVYTHTCGAIGDRLDLMEETGTDGIDTLDPLPLGTVDLARAVELIGGRMFIKGNLDAVNTLLLGTVEEVRKAAEERIRIAGGEGGYILSSACSVAPCVPPENLMVLYEVVERCGVYA
ncbi:MAG TPA: uroporphyrinogen decarboxylase family protein [bacterium]|nr:uroporphyrinogen decarboxylase family protein [bacterium]HQP97944.1 uroporphyrinogen decarboxylase family protein [bacterium]